MWHVVSGYEASGTRSGKVLRPCYGAFGMGDIWEDTCEQRCYLYRFDLVLEEVVVRCEIYLGLKRVSLLVNHSSSPCGVGSKLWPRPFGVETATATAFDVTVS